MFKTEHLEGRLLYETDEIVCINVFINSNYTHEKDVFLFQVLVSLKNKCYNYYPGSFSFGPITLSKEDVDNEILKGINEYFNIRKELGLNCPK